MKLEITDEQWDRYIKKYGNLMHKISRMIGGDSIIASPEDNFSELCMAAIESINGFHKKTGKTFDEMMPMKLFDQYTKTCLWTTKARKGTPISKKMPFRNKQVSMYSLDEEETVDIQDTSSISNMNLIDLIDSWRIMDQASKDVVKLILEDPDVLTNDGHVNISALGRKTNLSDFKSRVVLGNVKEVMFDDQ